MAHEVKWIACGTIHNNVYVGRPSPQITEKEAE